MQIAATVNKTDAALDDQLVLAVTVTGEQASLPEPELPPLPNFSVYSSGRNQSISFVNGRVSSSVVHTFVLVPRFVGKGTIAPIAVTAGGQTARTEPIEIQVRKPQDPSAGAVGAAQTGPAPPAGAAARPGPSQGAPPGGADLFVTARLDKARAYVDEQVILSIRFHSAVNLLGNSEYVPPATMGFLSEDLPPVRNGMTTVGGRPYHYSEIRTALFPAQAGKLSIGRATVRAQVQREVGIDPFSTDFFDRFFSAGLLAAQTREVRSEPLTLEVLPLPEGKPAGFSGAVGRFILEASLDRSRVKAGEAVTLSVTISGAGNLKGLAGPVLPALTGLKAYETVSALNLDKGGDVVHGAKSFKTVLVPRASGDLVIPPMSFAYFDAGERAYKILAAKPLSLRADPGDPSTAPAVYAPGTAPASPGVQTVSSDIRYLKTSSARPSAARLLSAFAGAGGAHAAPFAVFAACLGLSWRRRRREQDPEAARFREARERALERLERAEAALEPDPGQAAALLSEALSGYLADKLGRPAAGLTARAAAELLTLRRPPPAAARLDELRSLWATIDGLRFAPGSAEEGASTTRFCLDSLRRFISDMDKEVRPQ